MSEQLAVSVGTRYRVEQLLGQGGMGSVFRAHDRLTDQRVALKLVLIDEPEQAPDARGSSPSSRVDTLRHALLGSAATARTSAALGSALSETVVGELQPGDSSASRVHVAVSSSSRTGNPLWARLALAQEFRTLASLRHPNIISVLDYGFIRRSHPFFTMELLEGAQSLSAASQGLPTEQRALLLIQLLRALSYLHRHGILHRDLKPGNVMVVRGSEGPVVKLLDFGLSRTRAHLHTFSGEIAGTLSYLAPELLEGKPASTAADLFALGVIAYELFVGEHPFDRGDDLALIEAVLGRDPAWEPLQQQPALLSLLRRLLARSPAERPTADETLHALSAAVGVAVPGESVALRESALQAARFVGREGHMAILRTTLDAARAGSGGLVLIAGESGVGKSRLMEELRVYSLVQGVVSVRGQAVSEGGEAYAPWREVLRTLCMSTELDDLEAGVLKPILPDLERLLERPVPDAPVIEPKAAQLRLTNVIESLLLRQTEPLLRLLEDLHWSDAESLLLLQRLARLCSSRPILILVSYRDDERPGLPQELPPCLALKLERLSASSIDELCRSMLGEQACTPELVAFLTAETEGNVFFVIEVLRALAEEAGQLSRIATSRLPRQILTGGIQAIVQRRLARLPEAARPLLRLAAVAGRQLDLEVLRRFEPALEPWLYLCADAAVLEVNGSSFRFAHDKIRESLLADIAPADRQALHLLWAEALEAAYAHSAAHAVTLAEHYQRGGGATKAAVYLVEAGVHALSQGASHQAAALLAQALAPESRVLLGRVQAARGYNAFIQAAMATARFEACAKAYEEFTAAVGFRNHASVSSLARVAGSMLARGLQLPGAAALALAPASAEERMIFAEVAQATRWACETYVLLSQSRKCIAAALLGAELASAIADQERLSYFFAMFSYLAGLVPLPEASSRLLRHGARFAGASVRAELDFRRITAARHLNAGELDLAKQDLGHVIALSRQLGDEYVLMHGLVYRFIIAFREEDEPAFEDFGSELYARARRNQSDQFARGYPLYKGIRALRRRELASAERLLEEAGSYVSNTQDRVGRVLVGGCLARCRFLQGREAEALARAEETLRLAEERRPTADVIGEGLSAVTEIYLEQWAAGTAADRERIDDPLRRALAALRSCALLFPCFAPRALLWHARDAWGRGLQGVPRRLAAASLRRARRIGLPHDRELAQQWAERFAAGRSDTGARPGGELRAVLDVLAGALG